MIAILFLALAPAIAAEPAGRVLFAVGTPTAATPAGDVRALRSGDAIEEGDLLVTGEGRLQVVFKDGALLALHTGSRFKVERYRYTAKGDDSDGVVLRLLQGGLRTISGLVGKRNRADYRMDASVATIGIRGTEYSLQLGNDLIGSVSEGAIEVCNGAGCLQVGSGQGFFVPSLTEPPALSERRVFLPAPARQEQAASELERDEDGKQKPLRSVAQDAGEAREPGHRDKSASEGRGPDQARGKHAASGRQDTTEEGRRRPRGGRGTMAPEFRNAGETLTKRSNTGRIKTLEDPGVTLRASAVSVGVSPANAGALQPGNPGAAPASGPSTPLSSDAPAAPTAASVSLPASLPALTLPDPVSGGTVTVDPAALPSGIARKLGNEGFTLPAGLARNARN
jgi:hypothetical protein